MQKGPVYIHLNRVNSFVDILVELERLELKLSQRKLRQFYLFNKSYWIITNAIKQAAEDGYFKNQEFIEQFTVCFAKYYFRAVNDSVSNDPTLPTAWALTNKAASYSKSPQFLFLLMGANAHINHDLPLALHELVSEIGTEDLLRDVFRIDKILMKSGKEILGIFKEQNKTLNFLKRHFVFLYYRPIMYMILLWRIKAWRNYKAIKRVGIEKSNYQKASIRLSHRFLKLAKLLR